MPDTALTDNVSYYTASFHNTNVREQVVTTCTSATRPSAVEGRVIYETDTDLLLGYNGSAWVPFAGPSTGWTSFTPQIDQGASTNIAKTVNYSKWCYTGFKTVTWSFVVTLTAGGTAGASFTLTLPVTAASTNGIGGSGYVLDTSLTTPHVCHIIGASTTTINFVSDSSGSSAWGTLPNLALATGDIIRGAITFEIA